MRAGRWASWAVLAGAGGSAVGSLWPLSHGRRLEWPFLLAFALFAAVGGLLTIRRSGPVIGWIMLGLGTTGLFASAVQNYSHHALFLPGSDLPGGALGSWVGEIPWGGMGALLVLLLLLFPTGAPPSPRWRPVVWGVAALGVWCVLGSAVALWPERGPALFTDGESDSLLIRLVGLGFMGVAASMPLAAASFVLRFRRSTGIERAQLKWFAFAAVLLPLLAVEPIMRDGFGVELPVEPGLFTLPVALLPLAAGVAILRYRLYDIDRVISRTLAYALVTAALLGLYALGVVLLTPAVPAVGGGSTAAVIASTLAVAAAFGPVRRRVQGAVDRRFNRARYDALQTVEAFRGKLRDEVDLDELRRSLLHAVDDTVEPAGAGVWLRPGTAS